MLWAGLSLVILRKWLYSSYVLTPLARTAFAGSAAMYIFDSHTPGSGKSLLAEVVSLIIPVPARLRAQTSVDSTKPTITIKGMLLLTVLDAAFLISATGKK